MAASVVVIGGTSGLGREVAAHYANAGAEVVLTGTNGERCATCAAEIGGKTRGVQLDLTRPEEIAGALADVGSVDHLVLAAISRDHNTAKEYNIAGAMLLVTMKLVGYTEVVHALLPRMSPESSIVVFGGQALNRPYPGSTTVSTVNGGVIGLVHSLATELAPIRVNGIHPGIVGDSPYWASRPPEVLEAIAKRTPTGRLVTMQEVVGAVTFLLENTGVNGVNLAIDGGWMLL
ncbi:MAG TPA: SDR family oxidoreductase [Micromonosporaceae bacterium]|nr:SDR family oxidoreductase [Micromonosporaceae bacterium]